MYLVSLIEDLKINKRTVFLAIAGQTYYFLIAFFLFKQDFLLLIDENYFFDKNFYYVMGISFVMSFIWFFMNICVSTVLLLFTDHKRSIKYLGNPSGIFINSMICSIGYLTFAMLINFLLDYDFKHFISFSFSFIAVRIVWSMIKSLFFNKSFV